MNESHEMDDNQRVKAAFDSENWFETVHLSDSLLSRGERTSENLSFAARSNIKVGNSASALLLLAEMHEREPENTGILIALTRAQVTLGDAESALRNFSSIRPGSGSIPPKEFHRIRLEIGELMLRLNKLDELRAMIEEFDQNDDGFIDESEFVSIMKQTSIY